MGKHDRNRVLSLRVPAHRWSRGLLSACLLAIVAAAGLAAGCTSADSSRAADGETGTTAAVSTSGGSGEPQRETAETQIAPAEPGGDREAQSETGNTDDVPANAVAVVDGAPILRSELESWLAQQARTLEAQGKTFPAESSSEYQAIVNQTLIVLVQRKALELEAKKQGVAVGQDEIDRRIDEIIEQQFDGSAQRYEQNLRQSGATDAQARLEIRSQLLHSKLVRAATEDATVTEAEIRDTYEANKGRYTEKRRRNIAVILVPTREEAEAAMDELERGASFSSVAKATSRANAVRYTDTEGDFPPAFEQVAYSLATGETSEPVQIDKRWYIIKAIGDLVPARTRPFAEVKEQLRQQILNDKRGGDTTWFAELMKRYDAKTRYAPGFGNTPPSS